MSSWNGAGSGVESVSSWNEAGSWEHLGSVDSRGRSGYAASCGCSGSAESRGRSGNAELDGTSGDEGELDEASGDEGEHHTLICFWSVHLSGSCHTGRTPETSGKSNRF